MRLPRRRLLALVAVTAIAASACSSAASGPAWTFNPPLPSAAPAGVDQPPRPRAPPRPPSRAPSRWRASTSASRRRRSPSPQPGTYEVKFANTGSIIHDVTFDDGTVIVAEAGQTATGTVTIPEGGLGFICSIPGHKDAGMTGMVSVEGATAGGETGGESHGGPAPTTDVAADPNAPAYTLHDPKAPALLEGTVHDIDLVIEEKEMTVAEGFVQKVWTFGGTVPGPSSA